MFQKMFASAVFAGFGAGLIAALLHITLMAPIIVEAEKYESGAVVHYGEPIGNAAEIAEAWAEGDESAFSRNFQSILWTLGTYVGFAFMLVAGFGLAENAGHRITARNGMIWGAAGYAAFYLAPSIGLPPELPGAAAADLTARQIWQISTMVATGAGIAAISFGKNGLVWGAGIVAIALPHIIGAPGFDDYTGVTPPEMAAHFASVTLGLGVVSWVVMGLIAGYFWSLSQTGDPA